MNRTMDTLTDNPQVRQGFSKLSHAIICNFCSGDLQEFETPKPGRACNAGIGDLRVVKGEKLEFAQLPEMGQPVIGHCRSGTVQLFEVPEPSDVREQVIGPTTVQINEDDVGAIIDADAVDQPAGPARLPARYCLPLVPIGVVEHPAAGLIDGRDFQALSLPGANDLGNPAHPAAGQKHQDEQAAHADPKETKAPARTGAYSRFDRCL
jgi:hypothetical protein